MPADLLGCVIAPRCARDGIGRVRIELRLEPVLGLEWGFITPAKAQVQRNVAEQFEIVLNIESRATTTAEARSSPAA